SRQEVCESFDLFRSYQGGVYFANNVTKGYLLSGFPAKRDGFLHDGKLIISHGGGKAESLQQSKGETKVKLADDQKAEDKSVRALLTNYRQQIPLVLLIDDRYALFPYDLGGKNVTYAVLGVYNITHAWAEYETTKSGQKHVRFKFAFQWCEEQGQPWWHARKDEALNFSPIQPPVSSENTIHERRTDRTCPHCEMRSPLVFSVGWGCLNSTCSQFWTLPEIGYVPFPDELDFHEEFLRLRSLPPLDDGLRNIIPPPPVTSPSNRITTVQSFTRGMHCIKCGRLSCRFKWQHWECANCQHVLKVTGSIRRAAELKNISTMTSHYNSLGKETGIVREPPRFFGNASSGGHVQTFVLPEGRGRIHHIQHNSMAPQERVDTLFEEYQKQASEGILQFRRWPLRSHKLRGSLLTNYFSQNCGEPYHVESFYLFQLDLRSTTQQYVGGSANTLSWEEAPSAVIEARKFIVERTSQALEKELQFNEVLSAAYMEKQKIYILTLLVMDGAGVQQFYEHMVEPSNFRIAATARWIDPNRK
ncbi:hypothetical protein BT96DRAFT_804132, partial [Gymnopus androsaceus JB14]